MQQDVGHAGTYELVLPDASSRGDVVRFAGEEAIQFDESRLSGSPWCHLRVEEHHTHSAGVDVVSQSLVPKFENPPGSFPFKFGFEETGPPTGTKALPACLANQMATEGGLDKG